MDTQSSEWKTQPFLYSSLTKEEHSFLVKYSKNIEKSISHFESLSGMSYDEIYDKYISSNKKDDLSFKTEPYILAAVDVALRRCIPKKNNFHDNLLNDSLQQFVDLTKEKTHG